MVVDLLPVRTTSPNPPEAVTQFFDVLPHETHVRIDLLMFKGYLRLRCQGDLPRPGKDSLSLHSAPSSEA